MGLLPKLAPDSSDVLTQAVERAAETFDLSNRELSEVLGVSPSSTSRLSRGRRIDPGRKEGELALLFLRVFRSLDSLLGGDAESCRRWLRSHNHHLSGIPADLLGSVTGLVGVAEYLDAMRGHG